MSSAEQVPPENQNKIEFLLGELGKQEGELERVEQQPTEDSDSSLEEKRRRIWTQLRIEMAQNATIGENLIISDLRAGVNGLNQRLDRMSQDITCSICLTPWTGDQGRHHLVSLRCGHLFGSNCIHTAIRRYHRCPICRRRARHNDVRRIYGRSFLPP
ncbi:E3 ubiquitin-protein ligase RFWD3 isoform X2 [Drosophila rhopaloa]|uniref:E3 ubiquitin-protein ligase RFWD3 isoform X2 n=1 Tax=Drosophila rhopaloa TaxID=1041015 RepID=A0A6P4F6T6_DRORH|nr:E3 ubiquitin-protein ligase RFWD3 isoform X2 [Drosophila rhopaloa]